MKRFPFILSFVAAVLCSAAGGRARGQSAARPLAFRTGEELTYTAGYASTMLTTDVATVTFRLSEGRVAAGPAYRIWAQGVTKPFFSVFFRVNDVYETWLDTATLRPLYATSEIQEGNYRYRSRQWFDWTKGEVRTYGKNLKKGYERGRTMAIGKSDFDPVGHFFNLRSLPSIGAMRKGEAGFLNLVMIDTIRTIRYVYQGREIIEAPATGRVRCMKFSCQLATGDAQSFKEGSEFLIWISDDENRIPIYMETPIRVGRVQATLTGWKNLAHPFSSRLADGEKRK